MDINFNPSLEIEFIKTLEIENVISNMLGYLPDKRLSEYINGEATSCWKPLSIIEKSNFELWRKDEFKRHHERYLSFKEVSIQIERTKLLEASKAVHTLSKLYYTEYYNLTNGIKPDDIYELANICGIIDFIQKIYETTRVVKTSSLADYFLSSEIFNKKKEILSENLTNCKPKKAALVLIALARLKYIQTTYNETEVYDILTLEYLFDGTRQGLNTALTTQEDNDLEIKKMITIFK